MDVPDFSDKPRREPRRYSDRDDGLEGGGDIAPGPYDDLSGDIEDGPGTDAADDSDDGAEDGRGQDSDGDLDEDVAEDRAGFAVEPFSPAELPEERADLPVWGRDLAEVDGPLGPFFGKAAQTLIWRGVEIAVHHVLPSAGVIVRWAYYLCKYRAVLASLDAGRGADVQVGAGELGDLWLGFTIRLGAEDDVVRPRTSVLAELNFMDPLGPGSVDAEAPRPVAVLATQGRGPSTSLLDLFGIEAVRDHGTVLRLGASLTARKVEALIRVLRRRLVRVYVRWDPKAGKGTVTVDDGYGSRTVPLPLD